MVEYFEWFHGQFLRIFKDFFEIFVKTPYYKLIKASRGKSSCLQVFSESKFEIRVSGDICGRCILAEMGVTLPMSM